MNDIRQYRGRRLDNGEMVVGMPLSFKNSDLTETFHYMQQFKDNGQL